MWTSPNRSSILHSNYMENNLFKKLCGWKRGCSQCWDGTKPLVESIVGTWSIRLSHLNPLSNEDGDLRTAAPPPYSPAEYEHWRNKGLWSPGPVGEVTSSGLLVRFGQAVLSELGQRLWGSAEWLLSSSGQWGEGTGKLGHISGAGAIGNLGWQNWAVSGLVGKQC